MQRESCSETLLAKKGDAQRGSDELRKVHLVMELKCFIYRKPVIFHGLNAFKRDRQRLQPQLTAGLVLSIGEI